MNIITALSEYNQPIFIRICEKRDWNTTHGQDKFFQRRDRLSNDVFKWNMPASELIFHGNLIRNKDWECWKWPPKAAQKKNSVCCPIPPLKPFKFGSKHLFSCSGIASGLCAGLALFQKNHLFCLLFHFIFRTPPHPPPHLRTEQPCRKEFTGIRSYGLSRGEGGWGVG